jgi:hypothetical protein
LSKLFAIFFFAAIQGIITGVVCWLLYQTQISYYQNLKNADVESLSQQLANEKTASNKPRFESQETAHAEAEKEVTMANKIQASSSFKIKVYGGLLAIVMGAAGFVIWLFVFIFARLMTKPSQEFDLSPMERFLKLFIAPTIGTTILSIYLATHIIDWAVQQM